MARQPTPAKAYSYLRFSTPEQLKGDSLRRQTEAAAAYAKQRGLELDDELTLRDLGVSAFRGSNAAKDAALGQFLRAVEAGHITEGSYLLVENIDRLSRRQAWDALTILQSIVNKGVTVVTLMDRQEYSRDRMLREPWCMMQAYGAMIRAHEESATKSRRAKEAWRAAVQRAREGKGVVNSKHPSWLRYNETAKSYEIIPDRAKVLRRIFALAKQGVGKDSIAATLNREKVPVFGRGRRWYGSFIVKTLVNRAVLGELHPNEREYDSQGRRRLIPHAPIKDYYPAVIPRKEFELVAALSTSSNPRRGRHAENGVSNVLGGLARCPLCGETMSRVNKGPGSGIPYLVCIKAKTGAGCRYHTVNYRNLEDQIFTHAAEIVGDAPAASKKGQELESALAANQSQQDAATEAIQSLTRVAEAGSASARPPAAISARLRELEDALAQLVDEARTLKAQLQSAAPSVVSARLKELRAVLTEPRDLTRANASLRLLLDTVEVDYQSGRLLFNWRHGPTTALVFQAPAEWINRRGRRAGKSGV